MIENFTTSVAVNNVSAKAQVDSTWFTKALEASKILKGGYFNIIRPTSEKVALNKLTPNASGVFWQTDSRDCAWDSTAMVDATEKVVEPAKLKINGEICKDALDNIVYNEQFKGNADNAIDAIVAYITRNAGIDLGKQVFTQIMTEAASDSDVNTVSGTTITDANALDEIKKVYDAIPDAVLDEFDSADNGGLYIFMNPSDYRKLESAMSSAATAVNVQRPFFLGDDRKTIYCDRALVVPAIGLTAGTMFAAAQNNLVIVSDFDSEGQIEGQFGSDLSKKNIFEICAQCRFAATYVVSEDVVYYA